MTPRPEFHFTAPRNWLNDPNGLVYLDGEYHLFYQHNPDGMTGAGRNMHWGHAVSRDLLHWEHLPIAIPNREPNQAWSGSAIIDKQNRMGVGAGAMIAIYTRTGIGQCADFSTDRGRTWQPFDGGRAVLPYADDAAARRIDRDPRVFWHAPSDAFVLVLWVRDGFSFYRSADLKTWTLSSTLRGFYECPELVELPVDDDPSNKRWVLFDGDGSYTIGLFDGHQFTPESPRLVADHGPHFYATQCWTNTPDGRVIQIAWMRGGRFVGTDFSQQMTIPCELSLRRRGAAIQLHRTPLRELAVSDLVPGTPPPTVGRFKLKLPSGGTSRSTLLTAGEYAVEYWPTYRAVSVGARTLLLQSSNDQIEVVLDRYSIEVFADDGAQSASFSVPVEA